MALLKKGVFVVAAKRTAFGKIGGALKNIPAVVLQTEAAKAALDSANISPEMVDSTVIGVHSKDDGFFIPRHTALNCGIPIKRPALGVNRLSGSGFQSIISGAHEIALGSSNIVLTGGVDNLSMMNPTSGNGLFDSRCSLPMALTAENLAVQFEIDRDTADSFSLRSNLKWKMAQDSGRFHQEIVPITVEDGTFATDEQPNPATTIEVLSRMKTTFGRQGIVTSGTTSSFADGASAVVLASDEAIAEHNLLPMARIVGYSTVGVQPETMGYGPVAAIESLMKMSSLKLADMDLVEINEMYAVQVLANVQALELDMQKLNVNGGALAIGHSIAASGSRIAGHLAHQMVMRNLRYAVGSTCVEGGQGIAILMENV